MEGYLCRNQWKDYLGGKMVCREERQFTLFLYLAFLEKRKGSADPWVNDQITFWLGEEDGDLSVEEVYYEAALMRDYFKKCQDEGAREAEEFNSRLLHFCLDILPLDTEDGCEKHGAGAYGRDMAEGCIKRVAGFLKNEDGSGRIRCNLGTKKMKDAVREAYPNMKENIQEGTAKLREVREKACFDIAGMMMNATPDILVIYSKGEGEKKEYFAKALECKYKSEEGGYRDVTGARIKMQYFIQECVMNFLFGTNRDFCRELPKQPNPGKKKSWHEKNGTEMENLYRAILEQKRGPEESLRRETGPGNITNRGVRVAELELNGLAAKLVEHMYGPG